MVSNSITVRWNFHNIWIIIEKTLVKGPQNDWNFVDTIYKMCLLYRKVYVSSKYEWFVCNGPKYLQQTLVCLQAEVRLKGGFSEFNIWYIYAVVVIFTSLQYLTVLKLRTICYGWNLWKLAWACKQLYLLCLSDLWNLPGTALPMIL